MIQSRLSTNRRLSLHQNNNNAGVAFEVPSLSTYEIIDCLQELNIMIKEQDLLQPTEERVATLYAVILQLVFPWEEPLAEDYEDDENQSENFFAINVYESMHQILSSLGFQDFQRRDLTRPTPPRLAKTLSVIINYAKSCDPAWQYFESFASNEEATLVETQRVQDAIDEGRLNNKNATQRIAEFTPTMEELEQQIEQQERSFQEDVNTLEQHVAEVQRLRTLRSAKKSEIKSLEFDLVEVANECTALEDREKFDYAEMEKKIKETQQVVEQNTIAIEKSRQKVDDMVHSLKIESQAHDTIYRLAHLRNELREGMLALEGRQIKMNEIEQMMTKAEVPANETTAHKARLQQKIRALDASMTNLKNLQEKKREAMNIYMVKLPENDEKIRQDVEKTHQETQGALNKANELEQEINQCLQELEDFKESSLRKAEPLVYSVSALQACLDDQDYLKDN